MRQPLLSVIIPTHERAKYAISTIRSVLALEGDVEVIVCDTSAVDLISGALSGNANRSRLRLVRPGKALNVVENFNAALAVASGKFLTFIGDDDFVSQEIVAVARWASDGGGDAIKFSFPAHYFWPDFVHKTQGDVYAGTLRISRFSGKITSHDARAAAMQALANFGGGVMEMPRAYAGLISRELVDRIKIKYGELFGGVSPDIYSAFLISQEATKCVYIDYPVIVPGSSGASTAGQSASGGHVGALRDNPHIGAFDDLAWDEKIPEFYSVPTVWSYSLLRAVERHGALLHEVNFNRLYLKCLIFHWSFRKETCDAMARRKVRVGVASAYKASAIAVIGEARWISRRVLHRFLNIVSDGYNQRVVRNICDAQAASDALLRFLAAHPLKLD